MSTICKQSRQLALEHSQLQSLILQRTSEVQNLSLRLLKVQDEERRRLSRDLHDSTGQTLAALKIAVSLLQDHHENDARKTELISEVAKLADDAIEEIRTMSYLLHPPLLDEVGFECAAEWFVEGFAKRSGVKVNLDIEKRGKERLPMNVEIALFRVLQESLTNVHRHSRATQVIVCVWHQSEKMILEIRDNGCGIPAERLALLREGGSEAGVGLAGMGERLRELNGDLRIDSNSHGTTLRAIISRQRVPENATLTGRHAMTPLFNNPSNAA